MGSPKCWAPGNCPVCPPPPPLSRCHIILRPHPKNRPRLSRDNKIIDISLNTHTNRFKFKPHITSMYVHMWKKINH